MSLPNDFQSVIEEEYGKFGWGLANTFSFIAEFLGYKVYDISAVETALKIIATEMGSSLKKYAHPHNVPAFMKFNYPKVHNVFTRRAKTVNVSDEDAEIERKQKVVENFVKYTFNSNLSNLSSLDVFGFMSNPFYREYITDTITTNVFEWFDEIEEIINQQKQTPTSDS
jgi:hypothetical protein